ncbi:hypothetical protein KEM48_003939 [Puccinia striiformis f. sp. tritici PST-130]|nr:hypothetical protein KEM48_003939 [Puccinia striiformis f. sp. tritici PST-130]
MSRNMIPTQAKIRKELNYHYGPGHPMKPHWICMTHAMVMNYGLYKKMEIFSQTCNSKGNGSVSYGRLCGFLEQVNLGNDCPVFDGLFQYCSVSSGGSIEGAARLSREKCDIAVNWAGGLHHAKNDQHAPTTSASDHLELGTTFETTSYNPNAS